MGKSELLLLSAAVSLAWLSGTTVSAQTRTADGMQGMNWACYAGNGAGTPYPDGLTGNDSYEQAYAVGQRIGNAVKNAGGKSVRMPITPTLATGTPWWRYGGAINGVTSTGMKVILCHWPATGTTINDKNAWLAMWDSVNSTYGNTMMVRYEPINEPAAYNTTDLKNLYAEFLTRYNPPAYKCILDGTGYAVDVKPIGDDSRFNNQLLGLHSYHWYWGSGGNWQTYYNAMANAVGSHAWRTVVTEIGVQTVNNSGTFWQKWEPSMTSDIALLSGALAWCRDNDVATIAWSGINDGDWYHWFNANTDLTEANVGVADMFRWSWKIKDAITTQPVSQTIPTGRSVTFTVAASGSPTPTFQWFKETTIIAGATSTSYTIASPSSADAGSYSVTITNPAGSVTSNPAVLTVIVPPSVAVITITVG